MGRTNFSSAAGSYLKPWILPLVIAAITYAVFTPVLGGEFLNWDDRDNFLLNEHYRGLGWAQIQWMVSTTHAGLYMPLTWLTFGLNFAVSGMNPFAYHLTSLLLHALNAAVFYVVAKRLLTAALRGSPGRRRASDGESDRSGGQRRRTPLCAPPAARRAGRVDHRPRHPPLGPLLSLSGARVSPSRGGWCRSEMAMVGQRFRRGILGGRSLEGHRDDAAHLTVGARCLSARSGAGAMAWRRRREGAVLRRRRPRRHRRDLRAQPLGPAHGPRRLRSRSPSGLGRL